MAKEANRLGSQTELARRLGVTVAAVSKWVRGGGMDEAVYKKVCDVYPDVPRKVYDRAGQGRTLQADYGALGRTASARRKAAKSLRRGLDPLLDDRGDGEPARPYRVSDDLRRKRAEDLRARIEAGRLDPKAAQEATQAKPAKARRWLTRKQAQQVPVLPDGKVWLTRHRARQHPPLSSAKRRAWAEECSAAVGLPVPVVLGYFQLWLPRDNMGGRPRLNDREKFVEALLAEELEGRDRVRRDFWRKAAKAAITAGHGPAANVDRTTDRFRAGLWLREWYQKRRTPIPRASRGQSLNRAEPARTPTN
jgi:transcriptional regulator with XRE-family HTH domain